MFFWKVQPPGARQRDSTKIVLSCVLCKVLQAAARCVFTEKPTPRVEHWILQIGLCTERRGRIQYAASVLGTGRVRGSRDEVCQGQAMEAC